MPIILFLLKVYIKEYVFLDENVVCKLKVIFVNIMFVIIINMVILYFDVRDSINEIGF